MSQKGNKILSFLQFRIFLPLTLLGASIVRYNALSFTYLICLLITPLLRVPSRTSMKGATGIFLKCLIPVSLLPVLGHVIFHVTLVAIADDKESYGHMFTNCSSKEKLVRQIGYQRLDKASPGNIMRLVVPDASVFITAVVTLVLSSRSARIQNQAQPAITPDSPLLGTVRKSKSSSNLIRIFGDLLQSIVLLAAGVIVPSVLGGVYFIMFLIVLTLWGCYKSMGRKFGYVRILLMLYSGSHILLLHLYQFQFFQEALAPSDLIARIIGLTGVVRTDCDDVDTVFFYPGIRWSVFVNPALLLVLYWVLAFNIKMWRRAKSSSSVHKFMKRSTESGERQRLVENEEPPGGRYGGMETSTAGGETEASETGQRLETPQKMKRKPWMSVVFLIMKQSYVLSLIAMMAWSITYHSWLTFAFLLTACILWMLPNSRKWCLCTSPFILVYAELLLLAQYIFGMNLDKELPENAGSFKLDEIGLKRFVDPCLNLALQAFYTLFLVLTMRQYLSERQSAPEDSQGINMQLRTRRPTFFDKLSHFLWVVLCKYWIFFCTFMMAVISLQEVVIYRIIYMFFFLLFILLFQLNFKVWRGLNYIFWWVIILYSMIVLIVIYTYQFGEFHSYWTSVTGFSNSTLTDIGLERYDTAGLFVKLLTPTSFLVFVILQLRYFHTPFLKLSAMDRYKNADGGETVYRSDDETNPHNITDDEDENNSADAPDGQSQQQACQGQGGSMRNWMKKKIIAASELWRRFTIFLWRLGEIHIFKLVTLVIIIIAVNDVSAMTAVYVIIIAIFVPIPKTHLLLSHLAMFWTVIIILAKMIYQLNLVEKEYWKTNCSHHIDSNTNISMNGTVADNAVWFGLIKIEIDDISISYYVRLYLLILALIAFESIIRYHQRQYYNKPNKEQPLPGIIFTYITRPDADKSIISCIKFFANYFFYKFGLECCYVMTAITACVRVDAVALIYIIIIALIMMSRRRTIARIWPIYKMFLAIMLAIQFLVVLGFPLGACIEYPWKEDMTKNLPQWLFLPEYYNPPHSTKLITDFLQLLFVSLQAYVFSIELDHEQMVKYGGGDNADILQDVEENKPIPCEDFTLDPTKGIDLVKYLVFENMFWVTMAIIFITGVTRINIFSLIYVIAVFCFMWYGKEFFLKPLRALLRMWNFLIGYCILVLFFKTALQLIGCVYVDKLIENHQCWLVQLFGVNCLLSNVKPPPTPKFACIVEKDDAGLAWDVVCLTFLLLQRRIYSSHYFRHIVDTMQAQNNLVSRGAELINRIMIREVNKQNEHEHEILVNIKKQMKALKNKQGKLKKDYKEPEEHFQAIRAGDYYLFDDEDDEEATTSKAPTSLNYGIEEDEDAKPSPFQVVNTAIDQDMDAAVASYEGTEGAKQITDVDEEPEPESVSKIRTIINFISTLWYSFIDWLINLCNRLSRNYRLVAKKLATELVVEKVKILKAKDSRIKSTDAEPVLVSEVRLNVEEPAEEPRDIAVLAESSSVVSLDELEKQDEEEIREQFKSNKDRFRRLAMAIGLLLVSHSELLCYFLMILDQMVYGSLLSLPLPLMVFLWGMLSVPRPSKTFWVTVITYIEAIVVCKYMFQFGFFPWNDGMYRDSPFFPPRIIGIEKTSNYANVDIALLLALFLHRSILRKYGLWRDAADISADLEAAGIKEQSTPSSPLTEVEEDETPTDSCLQSSEETKGEKSKIVQGLSYIVKPFTKFFKQVAQSSYNATADVYAPMFFCDFILFLVLVFGFSSFGPAETTGDGDVASYIQDNKIPVPFLIMLITQFIFIVIDRALFLRKNVLGKFIFQILLVICIHVWMFFILPSITKRSFFNNPAAQIWYFIKCIYFGLSAYQIRCGYPNRILGNFLTKSYTFVNLFLFKGFLAIPFLLELRALMDWIWTDSTLAIGNWLQMEDIYANIFVLKCWREIEKAYPQERALKKNPIVKYISGGALLIVIIFIIWFPLVFFSFFNAVFISNPPYEASMTVSIGGYQPLFTTTALGGSIRKLTDAEFNTLRTQYSRDRNAYSFISGFEANDVTLVSFDGKSLAIWGISPVSQKQLIDDLANDTSDSNLVMAVEVKFSREPDKALPGEVSNLFEVDLRKDKYTKVRHQFAEVINGTSNSSIQVNEIFPRFLRLAGQSKAIIVKQLLEGEFGIGYSNISMELQYDTSNTLSEWWNLVENITGPSVFSYKPNAPRTVNDKASFITFNDKKAPESLSFLSGYGIIGLYISFILLIGRLLRLSTTNQYLTIMFRELPDVNRMMQLCLDLFLVREMKEFRLEEDLYAKIIFLYRSPETMVKFTRQTIRIGNLKKKQGDKKKKE